MSLDYAIDELKKSIQIHQEECEYYVGKNMNELVRLYGKKVVQCTIAIEILELTERKWGYKEPNLIQSKEF